MLNLKKSWVRLVHLFFKTKKKLLETIILAAIQAGGEGGEIIENNGDL